MIDEKKILEVVASAGVVDNMSKFDPAKSFKENGVDSLDVFTIFLAVEEQLGIKLSEEESVSIHSVNELMALINTRSS